MKKLPVQTTVFLMIAMLTTPAWAARYMVIFKDQNVFNQTRTQLVLGQSSLGSVLIRQGAQLQQPFASTNVHVQDSLQNLKTLVIETSDENALRALQRNSAIAFVEKEIFYPAPKPVNGFAMTKAWDFNLSYVAAKKSGKKSVGPKTPWGIKAVHAPEAWAKSKYGNGARVLILDSGIDKEHPALKDNFEKGLDFTDDSVPSYVSEDVTDTIGHGTHVAGTIAGAFSEGGFVGVAPEAKILAGRVCTELGCSNLGVTAGINWGIKEKVDVISMSLGGPFATNAEKLAIEAAEAAGIVVVAASGNEGAASVSYPAAFPTVISVGAANIRYEKAPFSNWGPQLTISAPGVAVTSSVPVGSGRESIVKAGADGSEKLMTSTSFQGAPDVVEPLTKELVDVGMGTLNDYAYIAVTGKFVLAQRGTISFGDKVKNAIVAGAAGIVIYNNAPGLLSGALTQDGSTLAIPVVMIEQTSGEALKAVLAAKKTAYATIQTVATDFASYDGTSMACPHVSGVVALLKGANKNLTPAQVRQLLKTTAQPMTGPNEANQYGVGLVDAARAVSATVQYQ